MKNKNLLLIVTILVVTASYAQEFPIVKNYGGIFPVPEAVELPDSTMEYKIVIDVKFKPNHEELNYGLVNIARMLNLHGIGGVKKERMEVVAVVHAGSAFSIMDNDSYKDKFGVENPNIPLIDALTEQGVKIFVCGQSLLARKIDNKNVYGKVKVSLSALTLLTTYQQRGYSLLVFN